MAETDPVRIAVDIIDNFSDDFAQIKALIQSVDRDSATIRTEFEGWGPSFAALQAAKAEAGRDVDIGTDFNFGKFVAGAAAGGALSEAVQGAVPGGGGGGGGIGEMLDDMGDSWRRLGKTLVSYRPSIMDWWNVLALLIPIMITLAGALVGVAAALGGVAVAAAGITGLGLLGWGDDFSSALENVTREARMLGAELFNVLRPAAVQLQPLMEAAFREAPNLVAQLTDELANLSSFGGALGGMGRGFIDWVESSLQLINLWREEIVEVANVVGSALGSFIQDFLVFGLREVIKNEEAYANLVNIFFDFFRILFEVSKAVTFAISQFDFLFQIGAELATVMSGPWAVAILTFATAMFLGIGAITNFTAAITFLRGLGIASTIVGWARSFYSLAAAIFTANTALGQLRALLATTGIGLVAIGAGLLANEAFQSTTGSVGGGTGTQINNVNIQGDVGRREMHQIKDWFGPEFSSQSSVMQSSRRP